MLRESSRQALVEVEVPNRGRLLKPGMFIWAEIELEQHPNATAVPRDALVRRNGQRGVFVADKAALKAVFVPFTLGIEDGELVEVVNPPKALDGAWVVSLGHHLLEDGGAIVLPEGKESLTQRQQRQHSKDKQPAVAPESAVGNRQSGIK